jgi:L-threonylcarbamoyladenylate synthase
VRFRPWTSPSPRIPPPAMSAQPPTPLLASLISSDAAGIARAAAHLAAGRCVAFPTETVYGLGASALDAAAVLSIFAAKGRPLTDPLIVHTATAAAAEALVTLAPPQLAVFRALARALWPGPLTLVAPAAPALPPCVTAGTGFVGVRVPRHATALALLRASGLPLAAPSANRFGHVSPTRAAHVLADLGHAPILVLEGSGGGGEADEEPCAVGIESTVCRVEAEADGSCGGGDRTRLTILRRGGVSVEALRAALGDQGCAGVTFVVKEAAAAPGAAAAAEAALPQVAPGQLLTHYAPDIPAFLVGAAASGGGGGGSGGARPPHPAQAVVLDYGGQLRAAGAERAAVAYRELVSEGGGAASAARGVFEALRWAEGVAGARGVLLADPRGVDASEGAEAVRDRLFRAASGRVVTWEQALGAERV